VAPLADDIVMYLCWTVIPFRDFRNITIGLFTRKETHIAPSPFTPSRIALLTEI
jgi:hypothetical protein